MENKEKNSKVIEKLNEWIDRIEDSPWDLPAALLVKDLRAIVKELKR